MALNKPIQNHFSCERSYVLNKNRGRKKIKPQNTDKKKKKKIFILELSLGWWELRSSTCAFPRGAVSARDKDLSKTKNSNKKQMSLMQNIRDPVSQQGALVS